MPRHRLQPVDRLEHHRLIPRIARMRRRKPLPRADQPEDSPMQVIEVSQLDQQLRSLRRRVLELIQVRLQLCRLLRDGIKLFGIFGRRLSRHVRLLSKRRFSGRQQQRNSQCVRNQSWHFSRPTRVGWGEHRETHQLETVFVGNEWWVSMTRPILRISFPLEPPCAPPCSALPKSSSRHPRAGFPGNRQ